MISPIPLFCLVSTVLGADPVSPATVKAPALEPADHSWTFDVGGRAGSGFGTLREQDEQFYKDVGFGVKLKDGAHDAIRLSVTALGLDGCFLKRINDRIMVGAGLDWVTESSSAANVSNSDSYDLASRRSYTVHVRWTPARMETGNAAMASFEIEPAFGWSTGEVRRFMVVGNNLPDTAPEIFRQYVGTANASAAVAGPHAELKLSAMANSESGFRYGIGLGMTYTQWSFDGDPMSTWTFKGAHYPTDLNEFTVFLILNLGYGG
jgi:hypothetical protein